MTQVTKKTEVLEDPPIARFLFNGTTMAWVWLIARLYLGYMWIDAALHKVNDPSWVQTGLALKGFWLRAVAIPKPPARPPISFPWYREFLQYMLDIQAYTWFGKLVAYGELLIGIALVLGVLTGFAAFFGAFMNFNFMLAGTASTNPVLFLIAILLILAWKTAGYVGVDRYLLPLLGTPWQPGRIFGPRAAPEVTS
ncbi:MAG: DoxX family membrane protein [Armatimonadetes bacterium]|nr:DoxX family membrane protein [Armatimonadota bacterium]